MKPLHKNLFISGQLSPNDFPELAKAGIKTIINNRSDNEEVGQFAHDQAKVLAEQFGIKYVYLPMSNSQPLDASLISDFKHIIDHSDEPILAHCRSGMRSTFLWAIGQISAGAISVDDAIQAATAAGIPLHNQRTILDSYKP